MWVPGTVETPISNSIMGCHGIQAHLEYGCTVVGTAAYITDTRRTEVAFNEALALGYHQQGAQ